MAVDRGSSKTGPQAGPLVGDALDSALAELERKIDRVRTFYEQYFMGIEKMEPGVARKEVTRLVLGMAQQHIRNTGQRFRFHSLQQKWNIYTTYWNRTMREIESGTYRRDVARLGRRLEREGEDLSDEARFELKLKRRRPGAGSKDAKEKVAASAPAPDPSAHTAAPQGAAPAAPPPTAPPAARAAAVPPRAKKPTPVATPAGMTEDQMRALYRRYVQAKRLLGDPNSDAIKYEALVATVSKQTPQIMQKYQCNQVEFTVVIKEDKVVLKANPKKSTTPP